MYNVYQSIFYTTLPQQRFIVILICPYSTFFKHEFHGLTVTIAIKIFFLFICFNTHEYII